MRLDAGHRLGTYEVLAPIGAGGMGEVYRARDTRLGREVAIKILPADRLTDESRRRRFVQEARAASALNHPNIVTIHEIESAGGIDFIVMEYVPGTTLNSLIHPRMRLSDAVRIAIPIADALARAHAAGIIHRDLKPANVLVTPDGVVKVLDFGLAKLMAPEETSDDGETKTEDSERFLSGPGTIAGTPGYMSPEQATGGKVDARSDIFAFGSLLYEMVTGRRAFAGGSRAETLAAVLHAQPQPPSEIVADVPRDLEKLILRCLRKEPERRFQHMDDVKVALDEIREDSASSVAGPVARVQRKRPLWLAAGLSVVLVAGVGFLVLWRRREPPPPAPRVVPLTATFGFEAAPTFSPDGDEVAFEWNGEVTDNPAGSPGNWDIWLKMIGSSETRRLTTDPAYEYRPSWSPDGRQIAFLRLTPRSVPRARPGGTDESPGTIHVVSPLGGMVRKVSDFRATDSHLAWSPDGRWLAARRLRLQDEKGPEAGALHLISLQTGESRAITTHESPGHDRDPVFSPDGHHLAYASCAFWWYPPCDVQVVEVAADFVPRSPPRRLAGHAGQIFGMTWSRDGRSLIYSSSPLGTDRAYLWRVRVEGGLPPERLELAPQGAIDPTASPSHDRLAFALDRSDDGDIFRFEAGRPARAVLASPLKDNFPSFSPDGRRIAFQSMRSGEGMEIWLAAADGSNPVQLTRGPGLSQGTPRFSPDGRQVVFESRDADGFADVWTIDTDGGTPRRVTQGRYHNGIASWSRDGRFIYYRDDRADGRDISRIPVAGGTPERVTQQGGLFARESTDGRWLFYTKREPTSPLYALELPNGPEKCVADCVMGRDLDVGPDGVYYLGCSPDRAEAPLYRYDPKTGQISLLGYLLKTRGPIWGIAVSPDGKTVLFSQAVTRGADLMLIEGFR